MMRKDLWKDLKRLETMTLANIVGQRRKLKVEFIPGVSFGRTQKVQKCTFVHFWAQRGDAFIL